MQQAYTRAEASHQIARFPDLAKKNQKIDISLEKFNFLKDKFTM